MNRDEARELLAWYAVGALDADEALAVEAHLADSSDLQQELTELQVLHRSVSDVADGEPVFRPALINDALRQIDEYEASRPASLLKSPGIFEKSMGWLRETLVTGWIESPKGARVAIVAQFALLLALGGIFLAPEGTGPGPRGQEFVTSAKRADTDIIAGGTAITVTFQPDITELQLRQLLTEIGAEIVAGPSNQGSFTIRVGATSEPEVARLLGQMRGNTEIIRHAAELE